MNAQETLDALHRAAARVLGVTEQTLPGSTFGSTGPMDMLMATFGDQEVAGAIGDFFLHRAEEVLEDPADVRGAVFLELLIALLTGIEYGHEHPREPVGEPE